MVLTRKQRARSISTDVEEEASETIHTRDKKPKKQPEKVEEDEELETPTQEENGAEESEAEPSDGKESEEVANAEAVVEDEVDEPETKSASKKERRIRLTTKTAKILKKQPTKKGKNELTSLIPGYTAERKLHTPSLDRFRPAGGIKALERRAEQTDSSTKDFVVEATKKHTDAMQQTASGMLPTSYVAAYSSFKKGTKRAKDESAGKGWFNMQPTPMTEELKTDLAVIRNRTYLDPKKFYKSSEKQQSIVQLGTVIEGASEYYSSRLTKKQRRSNLTEEILADPSTADYAKNKFKKMSQEKTARSKQSRKRGRGRR